MSYRATGFTSLINASVYGVHSVASVIFPDSFPIGSTTINDNSAFLSAANIGEAMVMFSSGPNYGDLWTTITAYTAGSSGSLTNIDLNGTTLTVQITNTFAVGQAVSLSSVGTFTVLNGKTLYVLTATGSQFTAHFLHASGQITSTQVATNVLTVTCSNTFLAGQQVRLNNLQNSTFLDGQTVTISTASGTQFTAPYTHTNYGPTSENAGVATNVTYGPTVDTGTVTGVPYATLANAASSDFLDNAFGKGYGLHGHNANTGGFPSFDDMQPNLILAIQAAVAANTGVYVPAGNYVYNDVLDWGALDPSGFVTGLYGEGPFTTNFVANNPLSAPPKGFIKQSFTSNSLNLSGFGVYGNAMQVGGQPLSGGTHPFEEVGLWFEDGSADNLYVASSPFIYGMHARMTQAAANDIFDNTNSFYELDGAVAINCNGGAMNFSPDAPGTYNLGGEGGLSIQCIPFSNYSAQAVAAFYTMQALNGGGHSQPISFQNSVFGGVAPVGILATNTKFDSSLSDDAQVGYLLGSDCALTDSYGGTEFIDRLATVVSSEGQIPWTPGMVYYGDSVSITSVTVTPSVNPRNIEGYVVTQVDILATNTLFPGNWITFYGLATATFLNGLTMQIITSSPTGFMAYAYPGYFTHTAYGPTADSGFGTVGQVVVDPAGHKQVTTTKGISGTAAPTWNDAGGQTTEDTFPAWAATTSYVVGSRIWDGTNVQQIVNGFYEGTTGSGVSGGSTPTWNLTVGGLTQDGSATWTNMGHLTWQDLGVFADTLAKNVTVERLSAGVNSAYQIWNAAENGTFSITNGSAIVASIYSSRSPIVMTGLTTSQTGLPVYYLIASEQRQFIINYYLSTTTAGAAGHLDFTFHWTDDAGNAQTYSSTVTTRLDLSALGYASGSFPITAKGANITVDLTVTGGAGSVFSAYVNAHQV